MSDFRHIHASLLNRVSLARTRRDLSYYRERGDLMTTTETSQRSRSLAFRAKGWDFFRPRGGAGERQTTVTWKTSVFERDGKGRAALLSNTRWRRAEGHGGNMTPAIFATVVPLRHKATGRKVFVLAAHLPSSVEGRGAHGYTDATPNRVQAHRESLESLQALAEEILQDEPDAAVLLAADWNMSHRRREIARWIGSSLDPLVCNWTGDLPERGTHGRSRVIDASYFAGLTRGAQKVFAKRASDHKAYRTEYDFVELKKPEPKHERGRNVAEALAAVERALRWHESHETKKVEPLREAREALLKV